tara:strand:+ start:115 stop:471 length:357 start_codon:yes stop_codon:yes gene_type:complete
MKKPIKLERVEDDNELVYLKPYEEYEKPLTVGELISQLEKLDPNKPVYTSYTDHTDWEYRTPLRGVEITELNVGIERETIRVDKDDDTGDVSGDSFNEDYVDTDIVNIEFVEHFGEWL